MTDTQTQHGRAWLATVLLAIAALICAADRTLPSLLMEPIKHAMALTDTQIGALTGFSFAIAMSAAALPLAWLADRYDRVLLLSIAIAVWCTLTILSGFAHDFTTLLICRLGVGIGEAALIPASLSLVADLFPIRRVARASAVLAYGTTLGGFVALVGGGALYEAFMAAPAGSWIPFVGADAWRSVTIVFGAIGLGVAVLTAIAIPEPRRAAPRQALRVSARLDLRGYIGQSLVFVVPFLICTGVFAIFAAGFNGWLAPFFSRTYGWSVGEVGRVLGATFLIASLAAPTLGVLINQFMRFRLRRDAPVAAIAVMMILALPFTVVAPLLSSGLWAAVCIGVVVALAGGASIVCLVVYVSMAPPRLRAQVSAIVILVVGLTGSVGSILYAAFTDLVFRDPAQIHLTLSVLSGVLLTVSIIAALVADRRYGHITALAAQEVG